VARAAERTRQDARCERRAPVSAARRSTGDADRSSACQRPHLPATVEMWRPEGEGLFEPERALRNAEPVTAAVSDALAAAAALQAYFARDPTYFERARVDERGRTVGGLVYVRNLLAHGLHAGQVLATEETTARAMLGEEWSPPSPEVEFAPAY
jgi:hypothetical protein